MAVHLSAPYQTVTVSHVTTDGFGRSFLVTTTGLRFPVASVDKHYLVRGATVRVYDTGLSFFYRVRPDDAAKE